ncbi:MAG: response regulator transcription factor [Deltaproteobacteria bacterium]|nr:response regulator transcription factor [Deltaproteobacteria bacterium]
MTVAILLVDDHHGIRRHVRELLNELIVDAVFGEAATVAIARELIHAFVWDIAVVDLNLPDASGLLRATQAPLPHAWSIDASPGCTGALLWRKRTALSRHRAIMHSAGYPYPVAAMTWIPGAGCTSCRSRAEHHDEDRRRFHDRRRQQRCRPRARSADPAGSG